MRFLPVVCSLWDCGEQVRRGDMVQNLKSFLDNLRVGEVTIMYFIESNFSTLVHVRRGGYVLCNKNQQITLLKSSSHSKLAKLTHDAGWQI